MCTMLRVQDLINLSMSPHSFASSMGYHYHAGQLCCHPQFSDTVNLKDVLLSKKGGYGTGVGYLQGLNFSLSNQISNPVQVVHMENHTKPNSAVLTATITWGNVVCR